MKRFNQSISIQIEVDQIADQLLSNIDSEFKHKELVAETIIGSLLETQIGISNLYNSLNGYCNDIDFEVNESIMTTATTYDYTPDKHGEIPSSSNHREIGKAIVKEINIYKTEKILIEYTKYKSSGTAYQDSQWVHHTKCSKIEIPKVVGKIGLDKEINS